MQHQTVLLREAVDALHPRADGVYVDCTFGRGGHSRLLLGMLGQGGRVIAIDRDPQAVAVGHALAASEPRLEIQHGTFADLRSVLGARGLIGRVDGILADLGVSSPQLDEAARGFSFTQDGPLDMRMDPGSGTSAADWINRAGHADIARVLRGYGEEREALRIASAILERRRQRPIRTTLELAELIRQAVPRPDPHKHPATRSFQAIRIFVNRELDQLKALLDQACELLAVGGRLAVISFHSLEDRMVKRYMRDLVRGDKLPPGLPIMADQAGLRARLAGKPVYPSADEIAANPRARSAVLRVMEKLR